MQVCNSSLKGSSDCNFEFSFSEFWTLLHACPRVRTERVTRDTFSSLSLIYILATLFKIEIIFFFFLGVIVQMVMC